MQIRSARRALQALLACLASVPVLIGAAAPATAVPSCRVGAYITDVYALDTPRQTVDAGIWFWSVCPRPELEPLRSAEFINASRTAVVDRNSVRKDGRFWTYEKVLGTYREDLSLGNYPFDRHTLEFVVEATQDRTQFAYVPDTAQSNYSPHIRLPGFSVNGLQVLESADHYRTTFGDPGAHSATGSSYSQFVVRLRVARADVPDFLRETWPVFASFIVALATFLVWVEHEAPVLTGVLGARLGLLGAALFTIVVNQRAVGQSLGTMTGLGLLPQIHLWTLLFVLVCVVAATYSWRVCLRPGYEAQARALNRRIALIAGLLYLMLVTLSITLAMSR